MRGESNASFARFQQFLRQGPNRSLAAIARIHGVSRAAIHETARRYDWSARAAAWDAAQVVSACPAPERLKEAVAIPPTTLAVNDATRASERAFLQLVEEFRSAVESLGRDQLITARAMTLKVKRSVGQLLADERPISARELPAFINATVTLSAAAQAQWAKSLGVDALLDRMEGALTAVDAAAIEEP
jgi:hypothetical protein